MWTSIWVGGLVFVVSIVLRSCGPSDAAMWNLERTIITRTVIGRVTRRADKRRVLFARVLRPLRLEKIVGVRTGMLTKAVSDDQVVWSLLPVRVSGKEAF